MEITEDIAKKILDYLVQRAGYECIIPTKTDQENIWYFWLGNALSTTAISYGALFTKTSFRLITMYSQQQPTQKQILLFLMNDDIRNDNMVNMTRNSCFIYPDDCIEKLLIEIDLKANGR